MAWNDPHPIVASPLTAPFLLVSCWVILKSKHVKVTKEHILPSNGFVFQSSPKITPHGTFSETCVWFFRFFFSNKFSVGKSKTFMEFLFSYNMCIANKNGDPRGLKWGDLHWHPHYWIRQREALCDFYHVNGCFLHSSTCQW